MCASYRSVPRMYVSECVRVCQLVNEYQIRCAAAVLNRVKVFTQRGAIVTYPIESERP